MPVRVIGMIGVAPPAGRHGPYHQGRHLAAYLQAYAQAHDDAGFDLALVGYTASSAEASWWRSTPPSIRAAGLLIAHRPGFVAPTLAAARSRPSTI
jgi:alkanesulfonate monooxygenase